MAKGCRVMRMGFLRKHTTCWLLLTVIISQVRTTSTSGNNSLALTNTSAETRSSAVTTTTTMITTTTPKPVIGESCSDNTSCSWNNSQCENSSCQCVDGFFKLDSTTCIQDPSVEGTVFDENQTSVIYHWKQFSTEVQRLILNSTIKFSVAVQGLDVSHTKNCTINQSLDFATCIDLSPGAKYNLSFNIYHMDSYFHIQKYEIFIKSPAEPGPINQDGIHFTAPNISLSWNTSVGLVDYYSVLVNDSEGDYAANEISKNNQSWVLIKGLRHGHNYTVQIVAHRSNKSSNARRDFFTTTIMPPYSPRNVTVSQKSITNSSLNLTWTEPTDFNGPRVGYIVCTLERIYPDENATNKSCIETSEDRLQATFLTAESGVKPWNLPIVSLNSMKIWKIVMTRMIQIRTIYSKN